MDIWSLEHVSQDIFTSITKFIKEGKGGIKLFSIEQLQQWRNRLPDDKKAELNSFRQRWADMDSQIDEFYSDRKLPDSDMHQDEKVRLYNEYKSIQLEKIIEYNRMIEKIELRIRKLESSRE
ncbi:MAG: hypothetical protein SCARUB_01359 [Candidatus Scalindua rubra]|uniref:Uncharacterized protein n=1 Tax=Candidatus Scalindua rubra TaxID=1872076 RepID=A0A1E3XD20_9BACT|nr:MAG: hypothetical protein SCARUB_01359 [Candidatus Scalindua rubra]